MNLPRRRTDATRDRFRGRVLSMAPRAPYVVRMKSTTTAASSGPLSSWRK